MSHIAVQKVQDVSNQPLPLLTQIENRLQEVNRRAFELFQNRGKAPGNDLDDWLKAQREVMGWPAAEVGETDREYKVEIALPGFEAKHVQIAATPDQIMIHANVTTEKKSEDEHVVWTEFGSNDVYRHLDLPGPIDIEKVNAALDHGLLKITVPKPVMKPKLLKSAVA